MQVCLFLCRMLIEISGMGATYYSMTLEANENENRSGFGLIVCQRTLWLKRRRLVWTKIEVELEWE
jgi:hypothetical protein